MIVKHAMQTDITLLNRSTRLEEAFKCQPEGHHKYFNIQSGLQPI